MYRKDRKEEYFTKKAQKEGYPARSVYKLKEIDRDFEILKKGDRVLDLGAAPGSWLLYISEKIGGAGEVIGFDIEDVKIPEIKNIKFHKKSIEDEDIFQILGERKFDAIVADLSPKTTGVKLLDSGISLELSEKAFEIAKKVLKENGNFVCKIFESAEADVFLKELEKIFKIVKRVRPKAVFRSSKEFYIVCKNYV